MFLSKLSLPKAAVRNPYDVHKFLWDVFDRDEGKRREFLFRVDWAAPGREVPILLQSSEEPNAADGPARLVAKKAFDIRASQGQTFRFALCANPIKRLNQERNRVPLVRHDERIAWLRRKLEPGASIVDADVVDIRPLHFRKGGKAGKVVALTYSGLLEVTDEAELRSLVVSGVGPAKSFGCGLLSLARA